MTHIQFTPSKLREFFDTDKWHNNESIYFKFSKNFVVHNSILGFDFDHTLFGTKSGKTFPIDKWDIIPCNIISDEKIQSYTKTHCVVLISNQGGIGKKKQTLTQVQHRFDIGIDYLEERDIPSLTIFSTISDYYRKPHTHMWRYVLKLLGHDAVYLNDGDITIVNKNYLYVGDAAGRISLSKTNKKKKVDFSRSDRMFAHNCRIPFMTPEEFESGKIQPVVVYPQKKFLPKYDYKQIKDLRHSSNVKHSENIIEFKSTIYPIRDWFSEYEERKDIPEHDIVEYLAPDITEGAMQDDGEPIMVMMMGFPGSGKSTIARKISKKYGWTIVSQDAMTKAKCRKLIKQCFADNKSVIVDNTHRDKKIRSYYSNIAEEYDFPVMLIWMTAELDLSYHLNKMRVELTNAKPLPKVVHYTYNKRFEPPNKSEGFEDIYKLPFILDGNKSAFLMEYS